MVTERNYSRILRRKHITEIGTMKKFKNRKTKTSQRALFKNKVEYI
jgi:hypothetical protein